MILKYRITLSLEMYISNVIFCWQKNTSRVILHKLTLKRR